MKTTITTIYNNGELVQTLINEKDTEHMEPHQFINFANSAEDSLDKMRKHNPKSEFAKQECKRLKDFIKTVYMLLDEKHAS